MKVGLVYPRGELGRRGIIALGKMKQGKNEKFRRCWVSRWELRNVARTQWGKPASIKGKIHSSCP